MKKNHMCEFDDCDGNGKTLPATRSMPQSSDKGSTITMVNCCENHASSWWDAADWNGSNLEIPLV